MNKLLLFAFFLFGLSLPCYAQFIGINIGIPNNSQDGVGNGVVIGGGGGGGVPAGAIQDDSGHYLQDDAVHYLIAG